MESDYVDLECVVAIGAERISCRSACRGGGRSGAHCPTGDDRDLTVCFRRSFVDAGRVPTSRSWTPSTRQLWCYAVILAAARNRPSPPRDTAEPAVPVSPKPCYSRRTEAF